MSCKLKTLNIRPLFVMYVYLFWLVIFCLCIGPELQESDPLEQRVGEGEESRLAAEMERVSEAQEEAEPDSGLGESSVEGGKGLSSVNI